MNLRTSTYKISLQHEYSMINLQNKISVSMFLVGPVCFPWDSRFCVECIAQWLMHEHKWRWWQGNATVGGMVCKFIAHEKSHGVANCRTKSQTRINEWMPVIAKQSMCSYTTSIYSITDVALDNRGCTLCSRKCAQTDDKWEQCVHEYLCERQQCVRAMSRKNDARV